jgi:hypothetical protein
VTNTRCIFSASAPEGIHHTTSWGLGASPERTVEVLMGALQKAGELLPPLGTSVNKPVSLYFFCLPGA